VIAQCSYEARSEAFCYRLTVEFASDEHNLAAARLIRFPEPIRAAVHQHMHALQDDATVLARDIEDTLHAINVRALFRQQRAEPIIELVLGQRSFQADANRADGLVVSVARIEFAAKQWSHALPIPLEAQIEAQAATWVDRQLVGREPIQLGSTGFGQEVREAMNARVEHLIGEGLAKRQTQRVVFARDLLDTLRQRELEAAKARIATDTGLPYLSVEDDETVAGVYRQRLDLASGRFAMIDDGLGFSLVPWTPSVERHLGHEVSGIARAGRIEWSFGRRRNPSLD